MAVLRRLRRRLRQTNPCTACLVVVFLAVVFYLISAIRGIYFQPSSAVLAAGEPRDLLHGPGISDHNDARPAGQRRRRKDKSGSFIVGDDDVQLCTMTPAWASSVFDQQDSLHLSAESAVSAAANKRQDGLNSCGDDTVPTLFYVDADGTVKYNHAAAAGGKYEVVGSCRAWKIEWNFDGGYVEKSVSLLTKIDADFVHVSCRVRRRVDDGGNNVDDDGRAASYTTPRPRRRQRSERHHLTSADIAERRARQMHRDQLRRHSPHLVGTVGLPDPLSNVITEERTASQNASESEQQATQNERQPRRDQQPTVEQNKPRELVEHIKGRKLDAKVLSRSERDLNHGDERGDDADSASTHNYDEWIAHIHPLDEVTDRERAGDAKHHSGSLNVLLLALESVSSVSFDRDLPKSRRFLDDQPHTVLFTGYNVIGDAAPANIIPMLTGLTFMELENQRVGGQEANFIDALPFVWNKFEQAGYVTLYAEDGLTAGGDTFHTDFHGFERPPVHHYMRPFWQAAGDLQDTNKTRRGCLGTQPEYKYVFRYVEQFLSVANSISRAASYPAHVPRFAFAFVSGSAEGAPTSLSRFDDDLSSWLHELQSSGVLERTAVVMVGDHGPSYGPRRQTMQGKTEERLPLLVVTVPTWFAEQHSAMMKNLARNSDRLVTPLDIHQTLLALLDATAQNSLAKTAALKHKTREDAISLLEEIPVGRTCKSAGVAVHWCMCTYTQSVSSSELDSVSSDWQMTADWVVNSINDLLRPAITAQLCQPLALMHTVNAYYVIPTDLVVDVENRFYYGRRLSNFTVAHPTTVRYQQIVVKTKPQGATFEATVVFNPVTKTRQISGEISRISPYGDQSDCVLERHPHLRRFCTCK